MLGYELTLHRKSYSTDVTWSIGLGKLRRPGIVVEFVRAYQHEPLELRMRPVTLRITLRCMCARQISNVPFPRLLGP